MLRHVTWSAGALTFLLGVNAAAQPTAPADPPLAVVPAAERLTLGGVFADADPIMKLVMSGLALAALAALAVWILHATRRDVGRGAGGALAYLSALGAAGPLVGFFGAAYCLLHSFIGLSNVRPTPSLAIMAPGFAEALMAAMLGLLAAAIAVMGDRHLKAKIHAAASAARSTEESLQSPARQSRLTA
ncbi:MotA/TolQ/ExbB proton channel family protein [Phenylobacterium sp.]|uniref:MotA/TolQ/ExbB proton channel family protein n=1 Tax=Phenylobacterium sp. TaxID=1871053 RepID=UPI0035B34A04